jgi:[ribosomal protein S18]-alanine N-acetyltransferase
MTGHGTRDQPAEIRPLRPDELGRLHVLDRDLFGEMAYPYFVLRQLFDLYRGSWLVIDHPSGLLGYSLGVPADDGRSGWLLGLGVRSLFRRRGHGRRLATASVRQLEAVGVSDVYLSVEPNNAAAIGLYEALGFTVKEQHEDYLGPGEHRAIMARSL